MQRAIPRETKLPGWWVFVPGLLLALGFARPMLLGRNSPLSSTFRFFWFALPPIAGVTSLAGLLCRLLRLRVSVVLAVLSVSCY
jgi:hypothetical protein